jgi:hypothetical protein
MKRWIWTILISLILGLAVGCGDKKSGGSSSPTDPSDPSVPPQCTSNCAPGEVQGKTYRGQLAFKNSSSQSDFRKLLEELFICHNDTDLSWWFGVQNCNTYDNNVIDFTVIKTAGSTVFNVAYVDLHTASSWGSGYVSRNLLQNAVVAPINSDTGYQIDGTINNDKFLLVIENQNLKGNHLRIRVYYARYTIPYTGQNWKELGYVDADVQ